MKWEYKIISQSPQLYKLEQIAKHFAEMGEEEWELTAYAHPGLWIFKRVKKDDPLCPAQNGPSQLELDLSTPEEKQK